MKAKQTRKPRELTAKQARFALLRARGYTKSGAYREAYGAVRMNAHSVAEEARRLCEIPLISRTIDEHLKEARLEDITTTQQILRRMLDHQEMAREAGNLTALAALDKTLCQVFGMTSQKLVLSPEKSETDEQLIKRLAEGDPVKETHLRALIGRDSFGTDDQKDD